MLKGIDKPEGETFEDESENATPIFHMRCICAIGCHVPHGV